MAVRSEWILTLPHRFLLDLTLRYRVAALLNQRREAFGDKRLGPKIGFTNRPI
jgi:hypothetical protein